MASSEGGVCLLNGIAHSPSTLTSRVWLSVAGPFTVNVDLLSVAGRSPSTLTFECSEGGSHMTHGSMPMREPGISLCTDIANEKKITGLPQI